MRRLTGVVTGGTKGIGLGIAEAPVKRKASLAITYHETVKYSYISPWL